MSEHDDADQMNANSQILPPNADVLIARCDSARPRRWHVGLQRLDRANGFAPLVPGGAAGNHASLISDSYSFAAGFQTNPAYPPARSNPVTLSFDVSVQINWGFGAAQPARLAADWPRMGTSLSVVGTFVEVFARWRANAPPVAASRPVATAWAAPADSGVPVTSGGELSLAFEYTTGAAFGLGFQMGALYVPDFARSVRLQPTIQPAGGGPRIALIDGGDIPCTGVFIDDDGNGKDSWFQGRATFDPLVGPYALEPVVWHPVPAAATMLTVIVPAGFNTGYAHWRIAP